MSARHLARRGCLDQTGRRAHAEVYFFGKCLAQPLHRHQHRAGTNRRFGPDEKRRPALRTRRNRDGLGSAVDGFERPTQTNRGGGVGYFLGRVGEVNRYRHLVAGTQKTGQGGTQHQRVGHFHVGIARPEGFVFVGHGHHAQIAAELRNVHLKTDLAGAIGSQLSRPERHEVDAPVGQRINPFFEVVAVTAHAAGAGDAEFGKQEGVQIETTDFEGAFGVEIAVNVGRTKVFQLQNALVHHGDGDFGVGAGFYRHALAGFGTRGLRHPDFNGQFGVRFLNRYPRVAVGNRQRQVGPVERTDERCGHVHVGQVGIAEFETPLGGLLVGVEDVGFEHLVSFNADQKFPGKRRFEKHLHPVADAVFFLVEGHVYPAFVVHFKRGRLGTAVAVGVKRHRAEGLRTGAGHANFVLARQRGRVTDLSFPVFESHRAAVHHFRLAARGVPELVALFFDNRLIINP